MYISLLILLKQCFVVVTLLLEPSLHGVDQACILHGTLLVNLILKVHTISNNLNSLNCISNNWVCVLKVLFVFVRIALLSGVRLRKSLAEDLNNLGKFFSRCLLRDLKLNKVKAIHI